MSTDLLFRKISIQHQQGLRLETPRARIMKETSVVDGGRRDLVRGLERTNMNHLFKSTIKIVRSMVMLHCGARTCSGLNFSSEGCNRNHSFWRKNA
jgi:hypothetical protein